MLVRGNYVMKINFIIILISLFFTFSSAITKSETLPIEGTWQIFSYQIAGYPFILEIKMK